MIPKLIHQTAKSRDIPEACKPYVDKLRALHPDWTYRLWTDEENLAFVQAEFPDLLNVFVKLPCNIMRADVIRYLLMYKLGGLYLDIDYEMLKPFDLTDRDIVLCWEHDGDFGPGNDQVGNSIFASTPGHPFFKMAIDSLKADPPFTMNVPVEASTGPGFVTRIFHAAAKAGIHPFVTHRMLFNPITPHSPRAYRAIVNNGVSYGIHHCHGTWRNFTLRQRIKMKLGRIVKRFL